MSFIGPRLFIQIDSRLRETFPKNKLVPFGGSSLILFGYLSQFSHVGDKPLYVGNMADRVFWKDFNNVVTLDTIFCQEWTNPKQLSLKCC